MAKHRTGTSSLGDCKTFLIVASLLIGCVLAESTERDFEFEDSDVVKIVKRQASEVPLTLDDEDLLTFEPGSAPDDGEGSGTIEPETTTSIIPGSTVFYRVTIHFTNLTFSPALRDINSREFNDLASKLKQEIEYLFRTLQGRQQVRIIQFAPGSVLVTLDLETEGFYNAEVLQSFLTEAIQTGAIGSYTVNDNRFSFRPLETQGSCGEDEFQCDPLLCIPLAQRCDGVLNCPNGVDEISCQETVCPSTVGREPTRLPRNGTNWANLMINNAFPCDGKIIGWEYYRLISQGPAFAGVWRQVGDRDFMLVDRTVLPAAPVGPSSVLATVPINVERGDFIGIYYPRNAQNNVIAQATLQDDVLPASEMFHNYYVQFFDDMVVPGSNVDIKRVSYQERNKTFAIRALMNYNDVGVQPPVYTCGSNEYTCDDGYCIQASFICDNQTDCPDGSDEKNCLTGTEPCLEGRFRCTTSGVCISRRLRCDGRSDCSDGSDEQFCTICRDNEYICESGQCVPGSSRCNGVQDCGDSSDEINCLPVTCSPEEYRCSDGSCISLRLRCNSQADCPGGDDEFQCPSIPCGEQQFRCEGGECISAILRCDGIDDCPTRTDELDCPSRECRTGEFRCNDGTCIPGSQKCDSYPNCPDMSDENPILCIPYSGLCSLSEFQCGDGACIQSVLQCDGLDDCDDRSDELDCSDYPGDICPEAQYRCDNGQCIDPSRRCNGQIDCIDGSDERECSGTCAEGQFTCRSGKCIPGVQRCDFVQNCGDGSDEEECPPRSRCRLGDFECANGECIDERLRCDGYPDCRDRSDEADCELKIMGMSSVKEGDMIRVICNLTGGDVTKHAITWLINNVTYEKDQRSNIETRDFPMAEKGFFLSEIYVRRSRVQDSGVYACRGPGRLQANFTVEVKAAGCTSEQFTCGDGTCIPLQRRCDRRRDCRDSSDEANCLCWEDEFTCRDGQCIAVRFRCDGRIECEDGSDEDDCSCGEDEFTCHDGLCIDGNFQCNGRIECEDGSDEDKCPPSLEQFSCCDGLCIDARFRCNGHIECDDGSDEENCSCKEDQFTCRDGLCVDARFKCNGSPECEDASDEDDCPARTCSSFEFTCESGQCIDERGRCNGIPECLDSSDELGCACSETEFTCGDGQCIPAERKCDRRRDCRDGSDEEDCGCSETEFTCGDGQCIPAERKCDRRRDCRDGSDEEDCGCSETEFTCGDGQCIPAERKCDRRRDCRDGSDEEGCEAVCSRNEFRCNDGTCVDRRVRCDRFANCPDSSDEFECACNAAEFRCSNGQCIAGQGRCNGRQDCVDNSDEDNCQPECRSDQFQCVSGDCIDRRRVCDGRYDCRDRSDERNCPTAPPLVCLPGQVKCKNGECIDAGFRCDGQIDCADSSDEADCPNRRRCRQSQFQCGTGHCLDRRRHCDGRPDCPDRSDEVGCPCRRDQFTCVSDGRCIPLARKCNGVPECQDGSDEVDCGCQEDEFTCVSDNRCIPAERVCDRRNDCADGSDERDCGCQEDEFTCVSDNRCVPGGRVCDRRNDCVDGSDEMDCGCQEDEFTCVSDGRCIPSERVCDRRNDCTDGSDERACACQSDEFTCESDGRCIPGNRKCDRRRDCADSSDERDCEPEQCSSDQFTCVSDNQCISALRRCDRRRDCQDGSDEEGCACRQDQFTCETTRECIPSNRKCDRRPDCADGSDERDCGPTCSPGEHKCDNRCIPAPYICNGRAECRDGSDEQNCPSCDEETEFTCGDGRCIPTPYVCNGRPECTDGSDEENCQSRVVLVITPQNIRVRSGQSGVFYCQAVEGAAAPLRWSRANNQRLPISATDEGSGRLSFRGVTRDDAGDYVCTSGSATATARLDIDMIGPTISPPGGPCQMGEATCTNGQCIPRDYLCDSEQDCSDGSDELDCDSLRLPCEPNEFQCNNGRCAMKIWKCDGDNDCGDGSDESNCPSREPGEKCRMDQFMCLRGDQCVPASYQCDGENDCQDRSDEIGCSVPTITKPPQPEISVKVNGTFTIYCEAIGVPTPIITWRLNWGHIPTGERVTSTSTGGRGSLTVQYVRPEDAGAYTCEALNNKGSIFATPDALIIVRQQPGVCQPPRFNFAARRIDECVRCFCFGHTEVCQSSNLQISQITLGNQLSLVKRTDLEPVEDGFVQYVPSSGDFAVQDFNRAFPSGSYYWSLPAQYLGNRLTSYGGDMSYRISYDVDSFDIPTNDPDVIIEGNGISLFYRRTDSVPPGSSTTVRIPLVEDDWEKSGGLRGESSISGLATRQDLMTALQNVSRILIRASYDTRQNYIRIGNILLTTAVTQASPSLGRAVYVEDCRCPTGYTGLSCESCAAGFYRITRGRYIGECVQCECNGHSNDCDPVSGVCLNCQHNTYGPYCDRCLEGFAGDARQRTPSDCEPCPCPLTIPSNQFSPTCVRGRDGEITCTACPPGYTGRRCEICAPGYQGNPTIPGERCTAINATDICDPRGSLSAVPRIGSDRCECKPNAEGQFCDRCKADTFYLSSDYPFGCIPCFCMGVTQMCQSTSWNRAQVQINFSNDRSGVSLSNMMQTREVTQGFTVDRFSRELTYRRFNSLPEETFYWKLPERFLGDKVTAYGGNLRFTLRYRPGTDTAAVSGEPLVELGGNDIILIHRADRQIPPNSAESFSIPLYEANWLRMDGQPANREHLLMALADLDFILIRATFTQSTADSSLSDLSLDVAENRVTGQDRAFPVEQCNCPTGYRGLSCEDCDTGYTRSGRGLYLGLCEPCQCNGHSNECDPETGVCRNCRSNTGGDNCELCLPGYYGDATRGSINDCQKCPCPLTEPPNQFSPTCILDTDGQVTCNTCPVGHTGRRCERCEAGYEGNPLQPGDFCKKVDDRCDCDPRGTVPNTQCDPVTAQCQCKAQAQGRRCASCKEGYFNMDEQHQQGCLACFCMGITSDCTSSTYHRDVMQPMFNPDGSHSFTLTNRRLSRTISDGFSMDASRKEITFSNFEGIQRERESLFLQLPAKFRGDKVSSYGGYLRFTLSYSTAFDVGPEYMDVDLEIISNDKRMYLLFNPRPRAQETHDYEILLRESSFRLFDGQNPTREAFLTMMADIDAILIRATYNTEMSSFSLRNLEMEIAVPRATGLRRTPEVESCRCPEGYTGLSCQTCAPGYLRVRDDGTALGRCTRCNCNGHATSCDPISGRCMDCQHNTVGERCERCAPGYYGDPTSGQPNDCKPCPCPLTTPGNQFSPTCFLDTDRQVTCDQCPPGYSGRDCGTCESDYAGNPREPGGRCTRDDVDRRPTVNVDPIELQVPQGSRVKFQCKVGGRPPFNVVWSRLDGRPLPAAASTGIGPNYELDITRVEFSDDGRYVCSVTNSYGTSRGIAKLTVQRPGQVLRVKIEEPRQVTAAIGSTVRLVCIAVSHGSEANYVLSWSKDGGILPPRAIDQNGVLVIPNLREGDAGQYTCTGSEPNAIDQATAVIRIQDITQAPTARIEPRFLEVDEGQSTEFRCVVEGSPTPTIRWTRGPDGPLPEHATVQDGYFRFANIRKSDEAEYYCTATNPAGTSTVRTIIYVRRTGPGPGPGPLSIIVRRAQITATIGSNVQLECYAQDNQNVVLVWSRQGGLPQGAFQDGGILNINNIQQSHGGNYICTGTGPTGSIGTATAVVTVTPGVDREAPTARMETDMVKVNQGSTATLRCIVTGVPRPTITWSRARGELTSNHVVQGEILRITQATMDDRGIYICAVSNIAGRTQASVIVDIERREMPQIELFPQETQSIQPGGSALFQCRVMGGMPAPTITWTRINGKEFTSATKVMESNGVLMFERVTGEEQGGYMCTATNSAGTVTLTASLVIEGPPTITITPGDRITAIVGERVSIECVGEGDPLPTVFWRSDTRRRSDVLPESYSPGDGTAGLLFDPVSLPDAGRYTCVARNNFGSSEENVDLTVTDDNTGVLPLVDIEGPDRLTLVDGQDVQLTCRARGLRSPTVRWRRPNNQPLPPGHSVQGGILRIPRITPEYSGEYQCVVTAQNQDFSTSIILIVTVTPRLAISPSQITARAGESVTMQCQPSGPGPFQIEWQKVGGVLPRGVRDFDGVLEIRQVTAADSGQYRCIATNNAGTSEGYATLSVAVFPTVTVSPKDVTRSLGSTVEFYCNVTGDPLPTIRWEKVGGSLPLQHQTRNGILVLYNILKEDEGRYICTASNSVGQNRDYAFLRVTTAPNIGSNSIGQSVQNVAAGNKVEFECIVTGTPTPTVQWSKLEGPLPASAIIGEGILIIPEVKPEDAGTYRCTATNVAGSVQSQVVLYVPSSPVISQQQDITTAPLGGSASLSCDALGSPPPQITWVKKDGDLPSEHRIENNGILYIPRVRQEDAGTYECQARNERGEARLPVVLVIGAFIPYFPQNPNSYMSFPPLRDVYLDLDILLSFRPEATDGMLLYNGEYRPDRARDERGDFVCFGLNGAYPEFRFDVGSGPAIIRGQNPLELNRWHTVHLKRQSKNGTLQVNDEPVYYGVAPGRFVGMNLDSEPMYLGGVPNYAEVPRSAGFSSGFVGSVSQVRLKGQPLNLGEAVDLIGVEQYDACHDAPCYNGGQCQSYNNAQGYICQCPRGFAGQNCEAAGYRCYPGACGDGRCYDYPDGSGFQCICPSGYSGEGCRIGLTVIDPAFNKTSFISYPTIKDGLLSVTLKLMFKPRSRDDGIILFNAQKEDGRGDFVAVIMKDGFVEFRFDTGSGPAILRSRQQILINEWANVVADRKGRDGMLIVNNEDPVNDQVDSYYDLYSRRDRGDVYNRGTTSGSTVGLNLKRPLYLGGVDPAESLPLNVGTQDGFVGCIAELTVDATEIDLMGDATESVNIADCGERNVCDRNPCKNGGTCETISMTTYSCICLPTFTGRNCDIEINECVTRQPCLNGGVCSIIDGNYQCSCPIGYMGRDCETGITIANDFEVNGNGYVELGRKLLPHRRRQVGESIVFSINTVQPNGLVFWQGQRPGEQSGGDYLLIQLSDGYVQFSYELGSGPAVITSNVRVDDGYFHTIETMRLGRDGTLVVDGGEEVKGASQGPLQVLNVQGNIYFGGVPDLYLHTDGKISSNFNGCVRDIQIEKQPALDIGATAIGGENVRPCLN